MSWFDNGGRFEEGVRWERWWCFVVRDEISCCGGGGLVFCEVRCEEVEREEKLEDLFVIMFEEDDEEVVFFLVVVI